MRVNHEFPPLFDEKAKVLVLGSFPSVKSREAAFYYGHPQNRFWKLMGMILEEEVPGDIEGKKNLMLSHGIALWDVIDSCEIQGSSDQSIKDPVLTDLSLIMDACSIQEIYVNGGKAAQLYHRYQEPLIGRPAVRLPSTSPANAAWNIERLYKEWVVIRSALSRS